MPIWPSSASASEARARSVAAIAYFIPLFEEPRGKVVQASPPGQPLVRCAGRFEINVLDPRLGKRFAEVFGSWPFHRADSQEQDLHLLVECSRIREHAVVGRLGIEAAAAAAATTEPA